MMSVETLLKQPKYYPHHSKTSVETLARERQIQGRIASSIIDIDAIESAPELLSISIRLFSWFVRTPQARRRDGDGGKILNTKTTNNILSNQDWFLQKVKQWSIFAVHVWFKTFKTLERTKSDENLPSLSLDFAISSPPG
jgi:hypothetical protein